MAKNLLLLLPLLSGGLGAPHPKWLSDADDFHGFASAGDDVTSAGDDVTTDILAPFYRHNTRRRSLQKRGAAASRYCDRHIQTKYCHSW